MPCAIDVHIDRLFGKGCPVLAMSMAVVLAACQTEEPTFAEQVLLNGKILTVDSGFSIAEALAIRGERIVAVGAGEEIEALAGPETRVIDLGGRTVVPGLIDNSMHFIRAVRRWNLQARIDGADSRSGQAPGNERAPAVSQEQLERNLFDFIHELNRVGLTSVYDVGRPPEGDISLLERMSAADEPLPLRVWHTLKYEAYDPQGADAAVALVQNSVPGNGDYLGLLGLGDVYLPMFDNPGTAGRRPEAVIGEFMKIAAAAAEGGFQVRQRALRDIAVQGLLDEFEVLNETVPLAPLRWTLAHEFSFSAESMERARALGMAVAVRGAAAHDETEVPLRDIQDSGLVWGLGSGATSAARYRPFISLGWAVTGKGIAGRVFLDRTVTREEALIAHTRSNAYLLFKENDLGSLEAGKFADLVVLDRDYLTVPGDEIFEIEPVLTMVGGRIAYDALGAPDAANNEDD